VPEPVNPARRPRGVRKGNRVTVCIAAACRSGEYVVTATDGALSHGPESMDLGITKMYWFTGEDFAWQFMYAGQPSNADLILENVRQSAATNPLALNRNNIQRTFRTAFKARLSEWVSDYVLGPFDMTTSDFKADGVKVFGEDYATKLADKMDAAAAEFRDELMVVGWGLTPHSVTIYGINQTGSWSGSLLGLGAIGAGRDVAMSSLLLHGINRLSTMEDTLYAVAAAKFAAERCDGVGKHTTMCVAKKAGRNVTKDWIYQFLSSADVDDLRQIWEDHGKVRIPDKGYETLMELTQRFSGGVSVQALERLTKSLSQKRKRGSKPSTSRR
jgi:hypothetical protein